MNYLRVSDGDRVEYPFGLSLLLRENPNTSFPREMPDELLAEYGVYPVVPTDPPEVTSSQRAIEAPPAFVDGAWRQQWAITAAPVPDVITPRQCRIMLAQHGLLSQVEAAVASMDEATRITWEYAIEFQRNDPLLLAVAEGLGLSSEQLDAMFIAAAAL